MADTALNRRQDPITVAETRTSELERFTNQATKLSSMGSTALAGVAGGTGGTLAAYVVTILAPELSFLVLGPICSLLFATILILWWRAPSARFQRQFDNISSVMYLARGEVEWVDSKRNAPDDLKTYAYRTYRTGLEALTDMMRVETTNYRVTPKTGPMLEPSNETTKQLKA